MTKLWRPSARELPDLYLKDFNSPYEYACPELCYIGGAWAVRNLVTIDPFVRYAISHPDLGHYDSTGSYQIAWSVIGNAAISLNVPILSHPAGAKNHVFEGDCQGINPRNHTKGIEVPELAAFRELIPDSTSMRQVMPTPTYPTSATELAFNFVDRVAQDVHNIVK